VLAAALKLALELELEAQLVRVRWLTNSRR